MENPKLTLIPSGYKSGKVYSILPTDGVGDFDYERNGYASRVRKDGLIEELTVDDTPRLDWLNSDCPSLLLEPQRTNQVTYSYDISLWSTLVGDGSITSTNNFAIAPDGSNNATRLQFSTSSYAYKSFVVNGNNSNYVTSLYLKSNNEENQSIFFLCRGNTSNTVVVTPEWQRFEVLGFASGSESAYFYFGEGAALTNDVDILAWGGQLELNSSYASSYIQTEATSETRLKDFIDGAGSSSLFNSLESTFFVEMASFLNAQTNSNGIELAGVGSQNRITLQYDTTNNQIRCDVRVLNSAQAIITTSSFDITNFNKMAITYKLNEVKFYVNGQLISTDTSVNTFAPNTLTEVRSTIAGISGGAFNLQAKIKDLRVYNRVLTQAEAIELTTI